MPFHRSIVGALWLWLTALACTRPSAPVPAPRAVLVPGPRAPGPAGRHGDPHAAPRAGDPIELRVVYPAPEDLVRVRDSSFLLGSVASGRVQLTINGSPVRVWPNGAWLAWIPFPPDSVMQFRIEARLERDSSVLVYPVRRDRRYLPGEVRSGRAWVDSMSLSPYGQVWLPSAEYLTFSARAAEGSDVRVRLPDGAIVRLLPQRQPEEVLPAIRAFERDTIKLRTPEEVRYVGVVRGRAFGPDPGPVLRGPSASLVKVLGRAALRCVTGALCPTPYGELVTPDGDWAVVEAALGGDTVRARWPVQVALLDTLPAVTEFDDDTTGSGKTDSLTPGRAIPGGPYQWFFPTGTRAVVTARLNEDLRIRLSPEAEAWVPVADGRALPRGVPAPRAVVGSVTLTPQDDRVTLRIPLTQRVPFQVLETDRNLTLRFYSSLADVDWMRYGSDALVRRMGWEQTGRDEVTFSVDLAEPVWGYRTRWSRNDLLLELRRPPRIRKNDPLRGRVIAIDPGHPPLGATGPTGLREAEANLAVSLRLRDLLKAAGARVVLTRTADTAVDLWSRVQLADTSGAELLVSIHNNALPDGVNPFTNNGTSVFYNQPRSVPLAAQIQRSLVRRLKLPDLGIGRADLAVVRPTWMPAVLCEGMFLILPEQEATLRSARGQRLYALGVLEGLRGFLRDRASQSAGGVGQPGPGASPRANPTRSPRVPATGGPERDVAP
jgi:N-acetylmuramoyl-L-alanine amidase